MKQKLTNVKAIDYLFAKCVTGSQTVALCGSYNARVIRWHREPNAIPGVVGRFVIFLTGRKWPFKHVVIK
ncbi:hypothetical protein GCM10023078_32390 [Gibbsiella greigii]